MTIAEIIAKLQQERDFGSRFPNRMIFAEDLDSYNDLIAHLTATCDETVNLAEFGKKDVVPQWSKVRAALSQYKGKQILLLSVGEYLRICVKRELDKDRRQFPDFWEYMMPESSDTRVIMPIFCARDYFERIIGSVSERQEDFLWELDRPRTSDTHYEISIYSPQFENAIAADAVSLEDWLRNWNGILSRKKSCAVITNQYRNAENSFGVVSVKTINSPFAFLSDLLEDAADIDASWKDNDFWTKLIPYTRRGMQFADLVLEQLNLTAFDFTAIAAQWERLTALQRELIWLWYRVYPDDSYFSFACRRAESANEIPARIRNEIFSCESRKDAWIAERGQAMQALPAFEYDESYFKKLDFIPMQSMRLALLTYKTHEERAYAVKTVSSMLRNGVELTDAAEEVKDSYPALFTYLNASSGIDPEVDAYFEWYRKNKVINRLPQTWYHSISFERFESRFKQLRQMYGKDCFTFWIDGFGVEWLPVFLEELSRRGIRPESTQIATAKLPTKTEYNHQWDENDPTEQKWMRLDSLSHNGTPDDKSYFSCIASQLEVFSEAAARVDELLDQHEYVAITGDHGSSRLAALAFHDSAVIPDITPKNATIRCFGRFCEWKQTDAGNFFCNEWMQRFTQDGKTFIVMKDYHHFKVTGNAAGGNSDEKDIVGEIHGGNTPEERLVPVIIVRRSKPLPPLSCKPQKRTVSRKNGRVVVTLLFNRAVSTLDVHAQDMEGVCTQKTESVWDVTFEGVPEGRILLTVVANGNLLSEKLSVRVGGQGIQTNSTMGGLP